MVNCIEKANLLIYFCGSKKVTFSPYNSDLFDQFEHSRISYFLMKQTEKDFRILHVI